MANGNPIMDALQNLFTGSPEIGKGLVPTALDVLRSPLANGFAPGTSTTGEPLAPLPSNALTLPPDALQNIFQKAPVERTMGNQVLGPQPSLPVDIASIIGPQTAEGALTEQPPPGPPPPPPEAGVGKEPKDKEEGGFNISKLLPLLLTGGVAGLGAGLGGNVLAGAAGFNQAFAKQIAEEGTKDFIVFDPETGDQKSIKVPKGATVQQKRTEPFSFQNLVDEERARGGIPESKTTEEIVEEVTGEDKGKVIVEKDGKRFNLPEDQLDDAIKQGFKQVNG